MKKIFTLVTLITAVVAVSTTANAQNNASKSDAGTTTQIVAPITITNTTDLNFGQISASSTFADVVIKPITGASGQRSSTNLKAIRGSASGSGFNHAIFNITGEPNYSYSITLPADGVVKLTKSEGTETMSLKEFKTNFVGSEGVAANQGTLTSAGLDTFNVGATLQVLANQKAGTYNGTYEVTVEYN
jgi:spore coat protein U-like protein